MSSRRIVGVFAVLFLVQLLRFSPSELEFAQIKEEELNSYYNERTIRSRHQDLISDYNKRLDEVEVYAPLIIGAGQGTTGTHLFVDATCAMGFVSLHYGIGCLPKHVLNISKALKDTEAITKIPLQFLPTFQHYRELLQRHSRISSGFLRAFRDNQTDPAEFRDTILTDLEEIIVWGKRNKVVLALHDTPYPMLMPEIYKLVQKHYKRATGKKVNPIILLSERDPQEYTERRIQSHGSYSWICRPSNNSKATTQKMQPTTFTGGAFDFTGCINSAGPNLRMSEIFFTMHEANKANQRQFLVDTFKDYQDIMKGAALFSYNMFNRENKTSTTELAAMLRTSFDNTLRGSNHKLRMDIGADFYGFKEIDRDSHNKGDAVKELANILVFKNQVVIS
jgi:hypothetical protein